MDIPKNRFKQRLANKEKLIGSWLMAGSPVIAEAMGCVGFDYLVLDMEHVAIDVPDAMAMLQALEASGTPALVRMVWNDMVLIKRILDAGAQSIMLPYVQDVEQARLAVSYAHYPPQGVRGVAGLHRASRWGNVRNYLKEADSEVMVTVQLETLGAVEKIEQIAAVDGLDGLFIGPADLAASMGMLGDMNNTRVQELLERGAKFCNRIGKPIGIVAGTPDMAKRYVDYGFDHVAVGIDVGMMISRANEYLASMREQKPKAVGGY
ncbi:MAG: HpcH/HpaI aldolase/citrate lyase family protein [Betaproteobacteria bacterium]